MIHDYFYGMQMRTVICLVNHGYGDATTTTMKEDEKLHINWSVNTHGDSQTD